MLKACTPIAVLLMAVLFRLEKPSAFQLGIVSLICFGVVISSVGELRFSAVGFTFQIFGVFAESVRLVMSDRLLKDYKLDSLSTLYYIAPPSSVFILLAFVTFESDNFPWERVFSPFAWVLLANGFLSFGLNVAIVLLITNTSALSLTVGGIFKDVLLVFLSFVVFGAPVSLLQIFGYSFSLLGMTLYKNYKSNPEEFALSSEEWYGRIRGYFYMRTIRRVLSAPFSATDESPDPDTSEILNSSFEDKDHDEAPTLETDNLIDTGKRA